MTALVMLFLVVRFAVPVGDSTWSGFSHTGYAWQVEGRVSVPHIYCAATPNSWGVSWVGIDGTNNNVVEQTGIGFGCAGGRPMVDAWWENYPQNAVAMPIHVYQGDAVWLFVTYRGQHYFTYYVNDVTHPARYAITTFAPYAKEGSAEWITERLRGLVFPSITPIWWAGAEWNGAYGIAKSTVNWYVPGQSANYILGPGGAATIMHPGEFR